MKPAGVKTNGRREETDRLTCVIKTKERLEVRHGHPNSIISGRAVKSNSAVMIIIITDLEPQQHLPGTCPLLLRLASAALLSPAV